jgi:hypothetical protein
MDVPSADELAAIAAAFLAVTRRAGARAEASRWALAGRLPNCDPATIRFAARSGSRWNVAGRLDV